MTSQSEVARREQNRVVVGAIDDNMVYPVLVWAHSLNTTATSPPHFVIGFLEGLLSAENISSVTRILTLLGISHEFMGLESDSRFISQGHISPTTFTKFLLADAISGLNVWIDVDTVATRGWDTIFDLVDGATPNAKLVVAERGSSVVSQTAEISKPNNLSFNAGVLGWPTQPRISWSNQLDNFDLVDTQEQHLFNFLYESHLTWIPETYNTLSHRLDNLRDATTPFIIHYAGAHKPWHLARRFSSVCISYRCPWSAWFVAEQELMLRIQGSDLGGEFDSLKRKAILMAPIQNTRAYSGRRFLRVLERLGPLGWIIVLGVGPLSHLLPRGSHPLHPLKISGGALHCGLP